MIPLLQESKDLKNKQKIINHKFNLIVNTRIASPIGGIL
jgi:hypothetical protein